MIAKDFLDSIYSDGSKTYVSSPEPDFMERVKVRLSIKHGADVKHVLLRSVHNGAQYVDKMSFKECVHGLDFYEGDLLMNEPLIGYQFYIVSEGAVYYYNQLGVTTYIPDETYNFKLLTEYRSPAWVKDQVFYQIFPERFCNGNPANDVVTDEYENAGFKTIKHETWEEEPYVWDKGHCLDFFGGDLEGVEEKIPYLKELGVTAVYLNPIFKAPSNHKYDCSDYLHVDEHFGGDEALASLSRALHENGMRLMLDISINHTGREHVWFKEKEDLYRHDERGEVKCWFDVKSLPQLDYSKDELRDLVYKNEDSVLKKWLKAPYSIDAWRFDVADVFARYDDTQLSHEVWPEIREAIRSVNKDAYILAEDWSDCPDYQQGKEWDAPMNYAGCGRPLRQFVGAGDLFNERTPELRDSGYKMTARDVSMRIKRYLAKLPYAMALNQFNLINSHDVSRIEHYKEADRRELKGIAYLQFLLPGAPSIYYGDECGIGGFVGEDFGARFTMPWSKKPEESPEFNFTKTLNNLKKKHDAMKDGSFKFLFDEGYVLSAARFNKDEAIVTIMSTDDKDNIVKLDLASIGAKEPEALKDLLESPMEYSASGGTLTIKVPAHEAYIFKCRMA